MMRASSGDKPTVVIGKSGKLWFFEGWRKNTSGTAWTGTVEETLL